MRLCLCLLMMFPRPDNPMIGRQPSAQQGQLLGPLLHGDSHNDPHPAPLIIPTRADLEAIYRAQVDRQEFLLTGGAQMVAATALLKDLLGAIRVMADLEAADGGLDHAVLRGGAAVASLCRTTKKRPLGRCVMWLWYFWLRG